MKKRLLALTVAMIMTASTLVACGGAATETPATTGDETTTDATGDDAAAPVEDTADAVEAAKMEAPSTDGWTDADKIYVYSWNDELGQRLARIIGSTDAAGNIIKADENGNAAQIDAPYTNLAAYVEYVNLGVSGTGDEYKTGIKEAYTSSKYPSIFAMDNDVCKMFIEDDSTIALEEIGITNDMYANAYQYTVDYATVGGKLKALTWQATPGCFTYRADIAEKVLGSSDPAAVQEAVKDWDAFYATADKMKEAGYAMLSGPDDIKYAVWDQQTQPWVKVDADGTETLQLDSCVTDYFEMAKKLYDGGYTKQSSMWSAEWSANFEGDVFGYFGCTWFVYWCIATSADSENSTFGQWRVTDGPVSYHWGGSYVAVGKDCPNTALAAFLIYELCCDEEIMYNIYHEDSDFVNNKAAIAKMISEGAGASDMLGGQNPAETWADAALGINLSNATYLDSNLKGYMDKASESYNAGTFTSADEAVQYVKDQVAKDFPYINQ